MVARMFCFVKKRGCHTVAGNEKARRLRFCQRLASIGSVSCTARGGASCCVPHCAHGVSLTERMSSEEQTQYAGQQSVQENTLLALQMPESPCSLRIPFHLLLTKPVSFNSRIRFVEHCLIPPGIGPLLRLGSWGPDQGPGLFICAADLLSGFVPGPSPYTTCNSAWMVPPLRVRPALVSISFCIFTILHLTPARYDFGHTPEAVAGHSMPDPHKQRAPLPLTVSGGKGALDDAPACSAHQVQVITCPSAGQAARRPAWAYSIHLLAQRDQGSAGSL